MNTLDIILLIVAIIGFAYGYFKGIIKQLTLGAGIIIGLLLAMLYYPAGSEIVKGWTNLQDWLCIPIAFAAILMCSVLLLKVIGVLLSGLLKLIHLGFIDSIVGAVFSTIIGIMLFVGAVNLTSSINPDNKYTGKTSQEESLLYKHTKVFTSLIIDKAEMNR
ncbi:MAG: CvpA family protein [Bacteroidaceae bacterium]|nr:CvpA family protein [Bacteroidaceae bacterium]